MRGECIEIATFARIVRISKFQANQAADQGTQRSQGEIEGHIERLPLLCEFLDEAKFSVVFELDENWMPVNIEAVEYWLAQCTRTRNEGQERVVLREPT